MIYIDSTQEKLYSMLETTENVMNHLLAASTFSGNAKIVYNLDLGFPHDVIRIAGGFATGIYVSWNSKTPFVPIDRIYIWINNLFAFSSERDGFVIEGKFEAEYAKKYISQYNQVIMAAIKDQGGIDFPFKL